MATARIWPATNGPNTTFVDPAGISTGTEFYTSVTAWVTQIWYWRGSISQGTGAVGQIFLITGGGTATPLGSPTSFPGPTILGWQSVNITPIPISSANRYKAVVFYPDGEYTATVGNNYWANGGPGTSGITNGILTAPAAVDANDGQASFHSGGAIAYPTSAFNSGNYWVDMTVTDVDPTGPGPRGSAFLSFFDR